MTKSLALGFICAVAFSLTPHLFPQPQALRIRKRSRSQATASRLLAPEQAAAGKKFALLVGINKYKEGPPAISTLQGPEHDAELMKQTLVTKFDFPAGEAFTKTLLGSSATKKAITDAFESQLIENAKNNQGATRDEGAAVVFYFAGHGSQVADKNHDEADGYDETILAYDSLANGSNQIVDDEIDGLFKKLSQYTSNITFILDSCHSGTGTRLIGKATIAVREVIPAGPPASVAPTSDAANTFSRDIGNGILPRNASYVTISGCLPSEKAIEDDFPTPAGRKRYGMMTYYLIQALNRNPHTTYRELMKDVVGAVSSKVNQTPQFEGDLDRPVFGTALDRADPPLSFVGTVTGRTFNLTAGAAQGLREGTFLAIYSPGTQKLSGEFGKLATARIINVLDFTATAELAQPSPRVIPQNAKVALVTPNFGGDRLKVVLDLTVSGAAAAGTDLAHKLRNELRDSTLIEIVDTDNAASRTWTVMVRRGVFRDIKHLLTTLDQVQAQPKDDDPVYYVVKSPIDRPLYDFWVAATDTEADFKIVQALEKASKQEHLRALTNATSPLNKQVKVKVVRVSGAEGTDGIFRSTREQLVDLDQLGTAPFKVGENYRFKVENLSNTKLYVTLLVLGTSGSVKILNDPKKALEIPRRGSADFSCNIDRPPLPCWAAGPPLGIETYKVIATTVDTNFDFLEQEGAAPRNLIVSPLQWFIDQAASGLSRDPKRMNAVKGDTWATDQIDLLIAKD